MVHFDTSSNKTNKSNIDFVDCFKKFIAEKNENNNKTVDINTIFYYIDSKKKEKKSYKDLISDKLRKNIPWLFDELENKKKSQHIDLGSLLNNNFDVIYVDSNILNLEWNKAASRLAEIIHYINNPSYDVKIGDFYIKEFGTHIQINDMIIPKYTRSDFFNDLTQDQKVTLYNISLNINAISVAA